MPPSQKLQQLAKDTLISIRHVSRGEISASSEVRGSVSTCLMFSAGRMLQMACLFAEDCFQMWHFPTWPQAIGVTEEASVHTAKALLAHILKQLVSYKKLTPGEVG
jgi:hypothetical protein